MGPGLHLILKTIEDQVSYSTGFEAFEADVFQNLLICVQ